MCLLIAPDLPVIQVRAVKTDVYRLEAAAGAVLKSKGWRCDDDNALTNNKT